MRRVFCCLLCLVLAARAAAQAPDSLAEKTLAEAVVTASRAPVPRFTSPESIRKIGANTLRDRQSRTVPEALLHATGVWVQKTNHGGGSPFVRGLTGNQTLLLVDGIRLNNATFRFGPNQYLNTVDPFTIDQIEVLHGGGSVQHGTDAFGGTVQVLTVEPQFSDKKTSSGQLVGRVVGRGMERSLRSESGFSNQKIALHGGVSLRNFGDLVGGDTTGRQSPSGYRERAFDAKGKFRVARNLTLTAAHQQLEQRHVPVFHKVKLENFALNEFDPQRRMLSYLKTDWHIGHRLLQSAALTLARQHTREGRISQKNGSTVRREERDEVEVLSANFQLNTRFGSRWSSRSGLEIYHDRVGSQRRDVDTSTGAATDKRGLYPDGATMLNYAAFSLHEWRPGAWTLTGGLRWNGFAVRLTDADLGRVSLRPSALVGSAGVLRQIGARAAAFVSVNTGFRAPNVDDLGTLGIVDFRFEVPNYDLRPERSVHAQAGFRLKTNDLQLETAIFRTELRDLIARVRQGTDSMQGYPVYLKINTEQAYIQGFEADVRWRVSPVFFVEAGAAWAFGQNLTRREPVRRIPPLNGRFALHFEKKGCFATAELLAAADQTRLAAGDRDDNRIPLGGTPGWAVVNVFGGWSGKKLSLRVGWQNVADRDYRYHGSGVNAPGRHLGATVGWKV